MKRHLLIFIIGTKLFLSTALAQDSTRTRPDIVLNFAGDCTFAEYFESYVADRFEYPFAKLQWFGEADVSMVNLENAVTTSEEKLAKEFNFRMHPKYLYVLESSGIDIVNLANNHVYDFGEDGLFDTICYLDSVGVRHVGAGRNIEEARRPVILTVRGVKIGFLGYFGMGDWYPATERTAGTAPRFREYIEEDIQRLRNAEKVGFVVVNFHWGEEKEHYPTAYQQELARFTIDAGVDLIIGHHPHVLQGVELYKQGIIVYSLGNFVFGGHSRKEYDTAVFQVRIQGKTIIPKIIPIRVFYWQPYLLEGSEGEWVVNQVREFSKIFSRSIF